MVLYINYNLIIKKKENQYVCMIKYSLSTEMYTPLLPNFNPFPQREEGREGGIEIEGG